jgi:DNA-binding GntR family transcriptional regulator
VIEALKRLEDDKLVESRPQWGSFVTVPTLEKVIETYQFREAIECQVARMVAVSLTPEQKEELGEIAQILDNTPYSPETTEQMRDMHFKFHTKLASYTGNLLLQEALRKINLFWILCKALRETRSRFAAPRYWHQRLLDVIAQGDPEEADKMMRLHIMDSLDPIVENWGKEE